MLMDVHAVGHNYSQLVAVVLVDYFVFDIFFYLIYVLLCCNQVLNTRFICFTEMYNE